MMKFTINAISVVIAMSANIALASPWHMVEAHNRQAADTVTTSAYTSFKVDEEFIQNLRAGDTLITLPLPNGGMVQFEVQPSSVLPPALAAKYPDIMTFKGHEVGNENNTGSFDISPRGFNGMFMHQGEQVFIDVQRSGLYSVYYKKNVKPRKNGHHEELMQNNTSEHENEKKRSLLDSATKQAAQNYNFPGVKTYRIAISTTGEYTTSFHGKVGALSSIVTLLARVNEIYERDLGIKFILADGNDNIIFEDPDTDLFFNGYNKDRTSATPNIDRDDANRNELVQQLAQREVDPDKKLGEFDIGHVLMTTNYSGLAWGTLCAAPNLDYFGNKSLGRNLRSNAMSGAGNGSSGAGIAEIDAMFVDTFAHEVGHQLGAEHIFNVNTGGRVANSAWEVGSGTTIMGYPGRAGMGSQNLQSKTTGYFHSKSIDQMRAVLANRPDNCGAVEPMIKQDIDVNISPASQSKIIPVRTAFSLTGIGFGEDGMTFTWEQVDIGRATESASDIYYGKLSDGPLYRFVAPTTSPERHFPSLATQLRGYERFMLQQPELIKDEEKGDPWVNVPRTLNFRLVARDGKGGGAYDETSVEVADTGSQTFKILPAPDQRILVGSPTTVNWQVAGTDGGRINCQRVDISYSNDEGKSWQPLVNGVNNNGTHEVTIPANAGSAVRLKLACSDNIFYAITPKLATKSSDTLAPQPESNGGGGGGGSTGLFALLGLGIAALLRRREIMSY